MQKPSSTPVPASDRGIIAKLLALFTGGNDPEAEKKRMLKSISKDVAASKYKFYRQKADEALPGLAKLFYETYKIIGAAQVLLENADQSGGLKSYLVASCLTEDQLTYLDRISDESITERAKTVPLKDLQEQAKGDLIKYFAAFDAETTRLIDSRYSMLVTFMKFIKFDYFFVLKKFDSNIQERNFSYQPKFDTISAEYVTEDIKDFLEVMLGLELEADWRGLFASLKSYKQIDVVNVDAWMKLVNLFKSLKEAEILAKIVRLIDKDPFYVCRPSVTDEHIADQHIQKVKTQAEVAIQKIVQEKRNSKIDDLAMQVFGTTTIVRTKFYTDKANILFAKKMLGGYIHVPALNYLKAFLLDFFKKDVRELVDIYLIRGQWSTNFNSQMLSESFHSLMSMAEKIVAFDDGLADDGDTGARLRSMLSKSDRDKDQIKHIRNLLKEINEAAQGFVNSTATNLISMGKTLKALIEDYEKTPHELLINWKEVEGASESPIKERTMTIYKKIYYFVNLLQFFVKQEAV